MVREIGTAYLFCLFVLFVWSTFYCYNPYYYQATMEELTLCPGLGPQKAQRLYKALHEPFKTGGSSSQ